MNFAVAGTIIEKLSGKRFDLFMKEHILAKLGLHASYNPADFKNISKVAVLYDGVNGTWVEDTDAFHGVKPKQLNMTNYVIGSNGLIYAPQGGCRITMSELNVIM